MRLAVLFSRLSGYMAACLQALKKRYRADLLIVRIPPADAAPFESSQFASLGDLYDRDDLDGDELLTLLNEFDPEALFMSGWFDRDYLAAARAMKRRGVPVIAGSDAQWSGSLRQRLGQLAAPWYLHPAIDVLWVAGERQRQLAARLGFRGRRCMSGYYACDWARFAEIYEKRGQQEERTFLFVGRYADVKGIDVLVEGYRRYRRAVDEPWPLLCVGAGPQEHHLEGVEGIRNIGFVQPDQLPQLYARASAFVLPSRKEPWGVVVQEAAAAGLPLICTEACGAAVHLLQDGFNGFLVETGSAADLARSLAAMSTSNDDTWKQMAANSHALSRQYMPGRWADTLVRGIRTVRQGR